MSRLLIGLFSLLLSEYYCFIAVQGLLRNAPPALRTLGMGLYLAMSVLLYVFIFAFRRIPWDAMPPIVRTLAVSMAIGFFVAKLVVGLFSLIDDIRRLLLWVWTGYIRRPDVPREGGITRSEFLRNLGLILGGGMMGVFIYGTTNRYRYRIHRVKIRFPNLPQAFHGMRLVQLSDIHVGSFDNAGAVARGVDKVLAEKPDLIVFTGDLVNNEATEIVPYKDIFARLKAPMGVYSTLGNHDYGDYVEWDSAAAKIANLDALKRHHADMGWRLLMNEHVALERGGQKIALIGIENWGNVARFPKYGRMDLATQGLTKAEFPFQVLLSHDPSHWDGQVRPQYPDIDLALAGHTHGMQFGIEIPGFRWSPIQYVYRQWAGLYRAGRQYLYVNRGFGFLGYPGRVGFLPEITVITLESGAV